MAKESSFDVVSNVDLQEVDNAYQQAVNNGNTEEQQRLVERQAGQG